MKFQSLTGVKSGRGTGEDISTTDAFSEELMRSQCQRNETNVVNAAPRHCFAKWSEGRRIIDSSWHIDRVPSSGSPKISGAGEIGPPVSRP